ncbi:MAG: hypothetical protein JXA14_17340, partial [Anaerolineae bacterium]|nr:hypothetical protein [Anaerolineae bacterium]
MSTTLDRYREDLKRLIALGDKIHTDIQLRALVQEKIKEDDLKKHIQELKSKVAGAFEKNYQSWYTEACSVVRQLIHDRAAEFRSLYEADPKRKEVDITTYAIQDWLLGRGASIDWRTNEKRFDDEGIIATKFFTQLEILKS